MEVVNYDGEPVVPNDMRIKARHDCSCLVRDNCRIIYDDWRLVPEDDKEIMWKKWLRVFRIPKDSEGRARKCTMQQLGISLRSWRVELNRDYVKTGLAPFEKFETITQAN